MKPQLLNYLNHLLGKAVEKTEAELTEYDVSIDTSKTGDELQLRFISNENPDDVYYLFITGEPNNGDRQSLSNRGDNVTFIFERLMVDDTKTFYGINSRSRVDCTVYNVTSLSQDTLSGILSNSVSEGNYTPIAKVIKNI